MNPPPTGDTTHEQEAKLPPRDWIVLPLLALLTVALMAAVTVSAAHRLYQESPGFIQACMGSIDPTGGRRANASSVCRDKNYESQWVEYRFNRCSHRAGEECGEKPAGSYRIVMAGSSVPMGHLNRHEDSFAALLPPRLASLSGRTIDLYNESMVTVTPHVVALRMDEILAAKPDLILLVVVPLDIQRELPEQIVKNPNLESSSLLGRSWFRIGALFKTESIAQASQDLRQRAEKTIDATPWGTLLLHVIYQSQTQYVKSSLPGEDAGFMRIPTSDRWQRCLEQFAEDARAIANQARAGGVPLAVVLIPNRTQAAILAEGSWPAGYDPYRMSDQLRDIVTREGGTYVDILPQYRTAQNPERGYFAVDGHPNAAGHATIAEFLANSLTDGAIPALKASRLPDSAGQGK